MRSCKRLKNINSVSGKLRERHVDPKPTVVTVGFAATTSPPLDMHCIFKTLLADSTYRASVQAPSGRADGNIYPIIRRAITIHSGCLVRYTYMVNT
jgi:hypothetical protein